MSMSKPSGLCDDWEFVGEDTGGCVEVCRKCGAVKNSDGKIIFGPATAVDQDILYCPEQSYVP